MTDKTFGINFSRLYTKLNGTLLTVGRVQTPAMGLVVARDEAIEMCIRDSNTGACFQCELFAGLFAFTARQ